MIWFIAIACLALGIIVGALFAGNINTNSSKIQDLETQIKDLNDRHNNYRDGVSDHFSMTAELVHHMTESYREVYQHLAAGAQELCTSDVASKLLPAGSEKVFEKDKDNNSGAISPPKDYATRLDPGQKGALAEDFGLERNRSEHESEAPDQST